MSMVECFSPEALLFGGQLALGPCTVVGFDLMIPVVFLHMQQSTFMVEFLNSYAPLLDDVRSQVQVC